MSKRGKRIFFAVVLLVVGTVLTIGTVKMDGRLVDSDEAAWAFNGYFLEMYLSGDWDVEKWREFDKYAQHPPAGKYVFGLLHRAIGEPYDSLEPRRFWFENDLNVIDSQPAFLEGLVKRLSFRKLIAGRYMAASFAAISAVIFFFLANLLVGTRAAAIGYALFIVHPFFRMTATMATGDSFFHSLCLLAILLAVLIGRLNERAFGKGVFLFIALAVVLGISFATKLIAYGWVVPVALCVVLQSRNLRQAWSRLIAVVLASLLGFAIAYALDPGLHGDPIAQLFERLAWRYDRIEIQQLIFSSQRLSSCFDRFCFFIGKIFFSDRIGMVVVLPLFFAGLASPFVKGIGVANGRSRWTAFAISSFFIALTFYSLPMAWGRYLSASLPFIMIIVALGADLIVDAATRWSAIGPCARRALLIILLISAILSAVTKQDLGPRYCRVPRPPSVETGFISTIYMHSLMRPGTSPGVHEFLYDHFSRIGDVKRAAREKRYLDGEKNDR